MLLLKLSIDDDMARAEYVWKKLKRAKVVKEVTPAKQMKLQERP